MIWIKEIHQIHYISFFYTSLGITKGWDTHKGLVEISSLYHIIIFEVLTFQQ